MFNSTQIQAEVEPDDALPRDKAAQQQRSMAMLGCANSGWGVPVRLSIGGPIDRGDLVQTSSPMEPEVLEAGGSEELGFFFKRLGEICFSPSSSQHYSGPASSLAVAARCCAVFWSGSQGVCGRQHTCRVSRVPGSLQQGAQRRWPTRSLWVSAVPLPALQGCMLSGPATC